MTPSIKSILLLCALLILFSILFPALLSMNDPITDTSFPGASAAHTGESDETQLSTPPPIHDSSVFVQVKTDNGLQEMDLRSYLIGVLAAEMPASFEDEALCAQAVAARTYTFYKMLINPSEKHPDADVCTDSACCKAYIDLLALQTKWADNYAANLDKIISAVDTTAGEYLSYNNEPILAVFHSSSSGKTEDSQAVWNTSLPYLQIVDSPETESEVPNYVVSVQFSLTDFQTQIQSAFPDAIFGADPTSWITDIVYSDSGRVSSLSVGGIHLSGTEFRQLLGLRSTHLDINITENAVAITTTGYGHGVGLSQYGANILAKQGWRYSEILSRYYPGTVLINDTPFPPQATD